VDEVEVHYPETALLVIDVWVGFFVRPRLKHGFESSLTYGKRGAHVNREQPHCSFRRQPPFGVGGSFRVIQGDGDLNWVATVRTVGFADPHLLELSVVDYFSIYSVVNRRMAFHLNN
jgi:hypothetical protein